MTARTRKYIDVDDFGNIENVIKKVEPAFVDLTRRLPGPVANFAQQQLSLSLSPDDMKNEQGFRPHQLYLLMRRSKRNG